MTRVYAPEEKNHRQENFPVASSIIRKEHRGAILAFYRFARAADDVADHPCLSGAEKLSRLNRFEATLLGNSDDVGDALPLRAAIAERGIPARHALDLLTAFRQDTKKSRYENWDELMRYCAFSAAPVGRFVLDAHGEYPCVWPASDGLCAALQIINHLQDCKSDYLRLNRVYIPQELLARHGVSESALARHSASPELHACFMDMVCKTHGLLMRKPLSIQVRDTRLALEIAIIERLANRLLKLLPVRDPLCERVHLHKARLIPVMGEALCLHTRHRIWRRISRRA